jgi:hypothetical protein
LSSARTSARSVCRIAESPDTITVSASCPSSSFASTRAVELSVTGTPLRADARKPLIFTDTVYVPVGTAVK